MVQMTYNPNFKAAPKTQAAGCFSFYGDRPKVCDYAKQVTDQMTQIERSLYQENTTFYRVGYYNTYPADNQISSEGKIHHVVVRGIFSESAKAVLQGQGFTSTSSYTYKKEFKHTYN